MAEQAQATGAQASFIYAKETEWGVVASEPVFQAVRLIGGEGIQQNVSVYTSAEIRKDGTTNADVYGTQRPAGPLPFELSPQGWNWMFWHLLGGTPTTTGVEAPFTHVIKATPTIPQGFTLEKQFNDLGPGQKKYWAFKGTRINSATFNFNVDQIVGGTLDLMSREMAAPSTTSINTGGAPTPPTYDPYTSVQAVISEGGSELGIVTSATLTILRNLDARYGLGSNVALSMRPRTRVAFGTATLVFADTVLYEKAQARTNTTLTFTCTSGSYSHTILLPRVKFSLNNSTPTVNDDGGIEVTLPFKAEFDPVEGTDVKVTIVTPEADITA